jgi:GGDEF domain-containing protein
LKKYTDEYNDANNKEYKLDFSYGAYMTEADSYGKIEEYLKIADAKMYEQKMTKPERRN